MFRLLNSAAGWCLLLSLCAVALPAQAAFPVPAVTLEQESPVLAKEGHLRLSWQLKEGEEVASALTFQLERSVQADFRSAVRLETGPDRASYLSGLRQGENYFRVRAVNAEGEAGPWSAALMVRVEYPSPGRVFPLMAVGAVLLVATVALILTGHARRRDEGEGEG